LTDGLKVSLEGELEKYSDFAGKNCIYEKTSRIDKLPSYLTIHFVRFYWKKESTVSGTKAGKAKILRSVAYPKNLDVYEFCSE
jgi:ubiquitin carboxyl-terminal hydrolase 14